MRNVLRRLLCQEALHERSGIVLMLAAHTRYVIEDLFGPVMTQVKWPTGS